MLNPGELAPPWRNSWRAFQTLSEQQQTHHYGDVSAEVKLAFTNYNWTEVFSCS
ncbi:hypothetical protein [Buttiauxella sp.]|uniref:hypothetical protein n=1 Tax=Buttiauxella sp. TaxID=1972222 RepID=UPI003C77A20B